jgi:signal transduction histidine kinase
MRLATDDMHRLIQAFLWLARDRPPVEHNDAVALIDVVQQCIDELPLVFAGGGERIRLELEGDAEVQAPRAVVEIVVRNLVLNALGHSDEGHVLTRGSGSLLTVQNRVCDRSPMDKGHGSFGFGLSIVTSLCERFGWTLDIDANTNGMFTVSVTFSTVSAVEQRAGT